MNQFTADESLVMLSALQHYLFCKRQCAMIHIEEIWTENKLTAEGHVMHEHVDEGGRETRRTVRTATSIRLVSHRLRVSGIADMVEFHASNNEFDSQGRRIATSLNGLKGFWKPFPVEYKHGKPKSHRADEVQLCAQAICLEEMLNVVIPFGALFYGEPHRRTEVFFDDELRLLTEETARGVHELIDSGVTPEPKLGSWCTSCSIVDTCKPKLFASHRSAQQWLNHQLDDIVIEP